MGAINSLFHLIKLEKRLYWSVERLEELRHVKLAALLTYCYENIPYYREQFKTIAAQPGDFNDFEDLSRFPILEKETLRERSEEFLNPQTNRAKLIHYRSSGSTGIPLDLWYHPSERLRMGFTVTRELLFNGHKPWHSIVNVTEPRHSSPKNRWYHRLGLMKERFLSVYDNTELNLDRLAEIQPELLIGFPSVLLLIGEQLQNTGRLSWRPRLLFTLAEVLTQSYRENLKRCWGIEPIDMYGANEVGHIAFQCSQRNGYHINADSVHVEIIKDGKQVADGERGEVVVTNFDLRAMPIIRYRVGDVAEKIAGGCSCGCNFPIMGNVAGRSDGFIVGENGKIYSALEISLLLKAVKGIKQFRLIQKQFNQVTVEYRPAADNHNPENGISRILKDRLGESVDLKFSKVNEIPRESSGKIRTVISELKHPYGSD